MDAETVQVEIAGETVSVRPIQSTDTQLETDFIRRLSPATKHYRFLGGVHELSPDQLRRLCDVDGYRSMAFVATVEQDGHETEIGVCRYAPNKKEDVREIAITVTDEWQHRGLGTLLARKLFEYAKEHGVKQLYSIDLAENNAMRLLANDLAMTERSDPDDARQVIYSLSL